MKLISKRKISRLLTKGESRISEESFLYSKAVPAVLIGMVVLTVVLILLAVGILVGFIPLI